jgi:hypothetical protein
VKNDPFISILLDAWPFPYDFFNYRALCLSVCLTLYPPPLPFNNLQHVNLYGIGMRTDVCSRAKERIRKVENKVTAVCQLTETGGRRGV